MPSVEDEIKLLKQQQAMQTEALRRIIEGNWTGASGAAGTIIALEGGQTTIHAAEFPPKE